MKYLLTMLEVNLKMNDSIKVAKWEIKTIIRNKTFIIMTFFVPLFILLIGGGIGYFSARSQDQNKMNIGIDNRSNLITEAQIMEMETDIINFKMLNQVETEEIGQVIKDNEIDGFLVIPNNVFETNTVKYYFTDIQGLETDRIQEILNPLIMNIRIRNSGYDVETINNLIQDINVESNSLNLQGDTNMNPMEMFLPFGLAMLMVFASIFSGATLMQSIIKEKNNRIVEILLSSINSWDLMLGKVIGYGIIGLTQISIWSISAILILKFVFDFTLATLFTIKILYMFIFFILGFILISAFNAIVGAGMKEPQSGSQSTGFLVMIPLIPLYFSSFIINYPEGILSYVLTYIPFTSATAMLIRLGFSNPPLIEIVGVMVLLTVANYLLIKLAAKIFRVGMLMYGKNASIKELFKWAKSSDF